MVRDSREWRKILLEAKEHSELQDEDDDDDDDDKCIRRVSSSSFLVSL
jgi:hypothetical protein